MQSACQLLVVISLLSTAASTLCAFPHQIAYFNEVSGGPTQGHRHLLHSNLDWGQGLVCLDRVLRQHKEWGPVAISYSGSSNSDVMGIRAVPVDNRALGSPLSGFSHVAISASYLWRDGGAITSPTSASELGKRFHEFFRHERPVHRLDESMLLYETAPFNAIYRRLRSSEEREQDVSAKVERSFTHLPSLANAVGVEKPSVSSLLHVLLLFGFGETGLSKPATGAEAIKILTDEELAIAYFGRSPFIRTRNGLRYRLHRLDALGGVDSAESHRDQCLATFGSLGLSLDEVIRLDAESCSLRDLLSESIGNFTFEQSEMSWTTIAYSHYVPPSESWTDRFGKTTTFSDLLTHMMAIKSESQSCAGFHVVQAILEIVNADNKYGILTPQSRIAGRKYLREALLALDRNQEADGSWNLEWRRPVTAPLNSTPTLLDRLVATGHALEVFHRLLKVSNTRPIVKSTRWISDMLPQIDLTANRVGVCPLTHALRGYAQSSTRRDMSPELAELFSN